MFFPKAEAPKIPTLEEELYLDIARVQKLIADKDFQTASTKLAPLYRRLIPLMIFVIPFAKCKEINKQLDEMRAEINQGLSSLQPNAPITNNNNMGS